MLEIIPNMHPIFVHFTVALISVSTLLYFIGFVISRFKLGQELLLTARWCLWLGALAAVATVIAGFIAYYSVAHDAPSHLAMTEHRNWAIATLIVILCVALWSGWLYYKKRSTQLLFIVGMFVASGFVMTTAWYGAEVVYRYGIGVMSLPKTTGEGHLHDNNHSKTEGMEHKTQGDTAQPHIHKFEVKLSVFACLMSRSGTGF